LLLTSLVDMSEYSVIAYTCNVKDVIDLIYLVIYFGCSVSIAYGYCLLITFCYILICNSAFQNNRRICITILLRCNYLWTSL